MKTLKLKLLTLISLTLLLTSCQTLLTSSDNSSENPEKTIIATYKSGKVTLKDLNNELDKLVAKNEKLEGITIDDLDSEQKEAIIKEIVINKISYKEAKKKKLNKSKDYKNALKVFKKDLLKQKLLLTIAKEVQNEENLKKNYAELVEKLKTKRDLRIRYIIVESEKEANRIYKKVKRKPNSFAYYAKKKSLDKKTAAKGGDLGFVIEDILPASLAEKIRTVKKGQITKPVLVSGKWVVAKLEDERVAEILPYEKSKDVLAKTLAKKAIKDFVTQKLEEAEIDISI